MFNILKKNNLQIRILYQSGWAWLCYSNRQIQNLRRYTCISVQQGPRLLEFSPISTVEKETWQMALLKILSRWYHQIGKVNATWLYSPLQKINKIKSSMKIITSIIPELNSETDNPRNDRSETLWVDGKRNRLLYPQWPSFNLPGTMHGSFLPDSHFLH